ncbi:33K [Bat mastadenovirus WIV10]|uniref:33K n=1 Tax=Bat mastadenovirus WIV10 TaxID=1788432 RepID=A0A163HJU5_9ADEN|nr:33K [Bat mastadenovirus WIV10]AMB43095.1 33K [Bat mastadenovirus WIV10]
MVARKGASSYKAKAAAKAAAASAEAAKGDVDMQTEPISSEEEEYSEEEGSYTDEDYSSSEELVDLEDLPEEVLARLPPEALEALKSVRQTSEAPKAASPPAAAPSEPPAAAAAEAPLASSPAPPAPKKAKRRWDQVQKDDNPGSPVLKKPQTRAATRRANKQAAPAAASLFVAGPREPATTKALREKIFPTLYAVFQQSRGQERDLKVKNRSLRSLTRSCLYHKSEAQLQRTLEDSEALFSKYCSLAKRCSEAPSSPASI